MDTNRLARNACQLDDASCDIEALLHEPPRLGERKAPRARPREALLAPRTSSRTEGAQTTPQQRRPLVRR